MALDAGAFARKLRGSKAMRHQMGHGVSPVLTSPPGWLNKDDYGLKQPLPPSRRSSPYLRVRQFDGEWARPDWRPASGDAFFAQKWQESGLGAAPADAERQGDFVRGSQFAPGTVPDADGLAVLAEKSRRQQAAAPDFTWLNEADFERYLDKLRELQPEFEAYCKMEDERLAMETFEPQASTSKVQLTGNDLVDMAQTKADRGRLIVSFLNQHAKELSASLLPTSKHARRQQQLTPHEHPVLGLQYAPPSAMHNELFAEPLPGRILVPTATESMQGYQSDNVALSTTGTYDTLAMGVVAHAIARPGQTSTTQWLANAQTGSRDNEAGKSHFRLINAIANRQSSPRASEEGSLSSIEPLYRKTLGWLGGHRAVSRESEGRDWEIHPGVAERPIAMQLHQVDMREEAGRPRPGTAAYISGQASFAPISLPAARKKQPAVAGDIWSAGPSAPYLPPPPPEKPTVRQEMWMDRQRDAQQLKRELAAKARIEAEEQEVERRRAAEAKRQADVEASQAAMPQDDDGNTTRLLQLLAEWQAKKK